MTAARGEALGSGRGRIPRGRQVAILTVAGLLAALVAGVVQESGALGPLERNTVRTRFALRHTPAPKDIVIIGIDDASFGVLRVRWPFPRSLHGQAIDRLAAAGVKTIVYDVQFTEPTSPRQDLALFDAIGRAPGTVLATSESDGHGHTNVLGGDANLALVHARAAGANLNNDPDGVITAYPRAVKGLKSLAIVTAEQANPPGTRPPVFSGPSAWIDYRGGPGTFRTFPFWQLLKGRIAPSALRGKIVIVGATAPTLQDRHPTPIGGTQLMAGPEVQANAIWTALHGNPLRNAPAWMGILALLLGGLAAPLAAMRLSLGKALVAALAAPIAYLVATQAAFDSGRILPVTSPVAAWLLGAGATVLAGYLLQSDERHELSLYARLLEKKIHRRTEQLWASQLDVLQRLAHAAESRDEDTGGHIGRMSRLCQRLGRELGMTPAEAHMLRLASAMHDVGKIGIPDRVLLKPGSLNPEEWATMKQHTVIGAEILSGASSQLMLMAETIARTHHERWDGSGYPAGLSGEGIPLVGRICAVCDVFDALLSKRPYKEPWPFPDALAEIDQGSGTHFDPTLVTVFLNLVAEMRGDVWVESPASRRLGDAVSDAEREYQASRRRATEDEDAVLFGEVGAQGAESTSRA